MSSEGREPKRDATDVVRCRLCGREFRSVNWRHLAFTHGWDSPDATDDYRRRFPSAPLISKETLRRRRVSQRRHFDRTGKSWSRKRLQALIRARLKRGLPINSGAVERDCATACVYARKLFGSWRALVESCRIVYADVALRVRRSREGILRTLRNAIQNGWDLSYAGFLRRDSALLAAAVEHFGNWSSALEAAGIDSSRVRRKRVWSKQSILSQIRALRGPLIARRLASDHRPLISAAKRRFGGWIAAVRAAGRPYPRR